MDRNHISSRNTRTKTIKRRKKQKGLRLIHIVLLILGIYVILAITHQRSLMKDLQAKKAINQEKIETLQKEVDELNEAIEESGTLEFIEKVARDELGMVKPREIIYIDRNKKDNKIFDVFKGDN